VATIKRWRRLVTLQPPRRFSRLPGARWRFMSVPIEASIDVKIGQPRKLFDWGNGGMLFYDLARDGQRGVAAVPVGNASQVWRLSIVQHWEKEFEAKR